MKNRLLPFGFLVLFLGFSCLLFSNSAIAANPDNTPDQTSDVRMHQMRSNQTTGLISTADILAARYQLNKMQNKSAAALGLNWMQVGPTNWSGRSRVVLFDNQDPDALTMYTGGVTGGVYKSTNKGLTWHTLNTESSEILRVTAMTQTSNGTLYAGTGEFYCGEGQFMGTGLYRSTDGMNFTVIPGTKPLYNDPLGNWAYIMKLASDPSSGRLFVATNNAIKYSDDGDSWTDLLFGTANDVVVGSNGTVLFVVDNHVYLAAGGDLSNPVDLSTGEDDMLPIDDAGWTALAISPSDPNVMYASIAKESDGFLRGIYYSEDGGTTWSLIFPPNPTYDPFFGNGCFANAIEVFPDNPYKVLLGGNRGWLGEKFQPTGYYDWTAAGSFGSFTPAFHHAYAFRPNNPLEIAIATSSGISTGSYTPEGFEYTTSNKNLVTSQFNSVTMTRIDKWIMGGGIRIGTQLFTAVPQNTPTDGYIPPTSFTTGTFCEWSQLMPNTIIFSGSNFGGLEPYVRSENLGETSALTFLGGISSTATDYLPSTLWETDDFQYSTDTLWIFARHGTIAADSTVQVSSMNCYECMFEYTVLNTIPEGDSLAVLDPYHARFFIYGTNLGRPGVYMTQDAIKFYKEPVWFQIGETSDILTCMALSSDLNYLWAGTDNGKLYRFSNLTLALDSATSDVGSPYCIVSRNIYEIPEIADRFITNIAIDPNNDNNVLFTLGNYGNDHYIYVSENGLDSLPLFSSAQGNLPKMPVFDGLFEMHGSGPAIIGTDMGAFSTSDIFTSSPAWAQDLEGMGDVPVTDLEQQTWENYSVQNIGYIAAASYGRGLFYDTSYYTPLGVDPIAGDQQDIASIQIHPNPIKSSASITYTLPETKQVMVYVYDLTGRLMTSTSFGTQLKGTHTSVLDLSSLPNGTFIIKVNRAYGKVVKAN